MGILLIVIGLVIMTVLAVKGVPILWSALVAGIFVLATSGLNVVEGITTTYMTGFSGYIMNYFLMFVLGAVFGKLCEVSGASDSIAKAVVSKLGEKYVVLAIIVAAAILAFGGVSLFVALFTLYPLGMSLFKQADIPRRLFPGTYIAGAATFAMTAPFTPSTQNIVPMAILEQHFLPGWFLVSSVLYFVQLLCAFICSGVLVKLRQTANILFRWPGKNLAAMTEKIFQTLL